MSHVDAPIERLSPVPLPENLNSVQPGGGVCMSLELAWGRCRRWWLRTFRRGYVRRMEEKRQGSTDGAPHDVLDPRDLKFCRNQCTASWNAADDPFSWRERIPLARWGLAEVQIGGWTLLALTIAAALLPGAYAAIAIVPGVVLSWWLWFYRDPHRVVPQDAGLLVSPADGKLVEITELDHHDFVGGPAVRIGIFLSIFNVHINRAPCRSRVIKLHYSPGLFLNALDPESAIKNENLWIGFEEEAAPHRKIVVRQIAGLLARRIVCGLRPDEVIERGVKFGMIKLGSRTEMIIPAEAGLSIEAGIGQKLSAGSTILARYTAVDRDE